MAKDLNKPDFRRPQKGLGWKVFGVVPHSKMINRYGHFNIRQWGTYIHNEAKIEHKRLVKDITKELISALGCNLNHKEGASMIAKTTILNAENLMLRDMLENIDLYVQGGLTELQLAGDVLCQR